MDTTKANLQAALNKINESAEWLSTIDPYDYSNGELKEMWDDDLYKLKEFVELAIKIL